MNLTQQYAGIELRWWLLGGTALSFAGYTAYRRWRNGGVSTLDGSGSPSLSAGITAPLPGMLVAGTGLPFPATSDSYDTQSPEHLAPLVEGTAATVPLDQSFPFVTPIANSQQPTNPNPYARTKPATRGGYFPLMGSNLIDAPHYARGY